MFEGKDARSFVVGVEKEGPVRRFALDGTPMETIAEGPGGVMSYSTGTTDYEGALGQLVRQGVRRYVGEFWCLDPEGWRDDVSFASTYLRGKIDAAFDRAQN